MSTLFRIARRIGLPAVFLIGFFVFVGATAPWIVPHDPTSQDLMASNESFSLEHPLGTDHLGRDTMSRLIMGARTTLVAVATVILFAMCVGGLIGTLSGYVGGLVDEALMRFVDFGLSVPSMIVALAVIGVFGPGYWNMILALTIAWVPSYARLSRATVAATVHQPHIESLWVLGASHPRIIFRHLAPTALSAILVYASADAGVLALTIATLSFLGLGVQPPMAEWGQMLVDALPYLEESPRQVILPGLALTIMVIGFNLLGEGLALYRAPRAIGAKALERRRQLLLREGEI
ncbi:ABC transporter permease subunit [Ancylobacter sp. Lp-2]|uniref:ABC transporter permease n=1 Tax=Ancylobacter sp. Lp-2 TaxID=2881339 RepID=UPI001E58F6AF|nr:ABC transporter permease subunit [Ancylobacter sp. Lp-2]MCB4771022.1 ABC transporter permease subunit [Ancylobacter sp. Lp-2]